MAVVQLRKRRSKQASTWTILGAQLLIVVGVLGLWEYASGRWVETYVVSKPSLVALSFVELIGTGKLWLHTRVTLMEILVGYPIGSLAGILTGYLLGKSRTAARVLEPILMGLYGIPRTALAPLFIIWLGIGIWSKVGVVILMTFFLTFFNTYSGMRHIDRDFINLALLMGAKGATITFRVVFPSISPQVFVGLKTALPQAVIGAVVGEFIVSTAGLGYYIRQAAALFDPAGLWVGVLILMVAVLLINWGLDALGGWLMQWKPQDESEEGMQVSN
ncbi:MAG: ABC transporter permease [Actinobacteria bacterium]|nr:ABC transporter permease [Actinomycetota bacterium]